MKNKIVMIVSLLAFAFTVSSCYKDDVDELRTRVDGINNTLGMDAPLTVEFDTKNDLNHAVVKNTVFYYVSHNGNYFMRETEDGFYEVYLEKYSDIDWTESAWMYFEYNPETGEVKTSQVGIRFYSHDLDEVETWFNDAQPTADVKYTVKEFDAATGRVSFTMEANSTADYTLNYYTNKPMNMTASFKGNLDVYQYNPNPN